MQCNMQTSPRQLSRAPLSSLSCSASSNIFSGCCVCTHRNHVITACQGFLCQETFAYSNVLKSDACHGWFSNVHNHIVGLCICSDQLIDASSTLFSAFFQFTIKLNRESFPAFLFLTCIFMLVHVRIPSYHAPTHFWFTARLFPAKRHYKPTNKR